MTMGPAVAVASMLSKRHGRSSGESLILLFYVCARECKPTYTCKHGAFFICMPGYEVLKEPARIGGAQAACKVYTERAARQH